MFRLLMLMFSMATGTAPSTQPATTESALPPATLVTLHLKDVPASEAVTKLLEQAEMSMKLEQYVESRLRGLTVTIDVEKQPFLVVLREVCRQCYLQPQNGQPSGPRIGFFSRMPSTRNSTGPATTRVAASMPIPVDAPPWMVSDLQQMRVLSTRPATTRRTWVDSRFACVRGGILIVPETASRTSSTPTSDLNGAPEQGLRLQFSTMVDPAITLYAMSTTMQVEEAQDGEGNSLLRASPQPPSRELSYNYNAAQWEWTTTAQLAYPSKPAGTLALLRGKIAASIVSRSESFTLENIGEGAIGQRKISDMNFDFGALKKDERSGRARLEVTVSATGDKDVMEELRDVLSNSARVRATDASGHPVGANLLLNRSRGMVRGHLEFFATRPAVGGKREAASPAKIVWTVPIEVSDLQIPVEFRDLPLP